MNHFSDHIGSRSYQSQQLPIAIVVELVRLPHMPSGYQSLIALGRPWSVDGFLIAMRVDGAQSNAAFNIHLQTHSDVLSF